VWLAGWEARREPDAHARRCASDAIDAALRGLHAMRARLAGEIRQSDDASAARADVLLARLGVISDDRLAAVRPARVDAVLAEKFTEPLDLITQGWKDCPLPLAGGLCSSWITCWRTWFKSAPSFASTCAATPSPSSRRASRICSVPM
jgi:hypothetical protein